MYSVNVFVMNERMNWLTECIEVSVVISHAFTSLPGTLREGTQPPMGADHSLASHLALRSNL